MKNLGEQPVTPASRKENADCRQPPCLKYREASRTLTGKQEVALLGSKHQRLGESREAELFNHDDACARCRLIFYAHERSGPGVGALLERVRNLLLS